MTVASFRSAVISIRVKEWVYMYGGANIGVSTVEVVRVCLGFLDFKA